MTKITPSSSKITACPECDSGNLHVSGSEVECISCGWKHTAKKTRTTKAKTKDELLASPIVQDALSTLDMSPEDFSKCMDRAAEQGSIAAQLAAAITQNNKDTAPYNLTKCPECGSEELYAGRVVDGTVQDEQLVGGCHACDWAYDVRSKKTRQAPSTSFVLTSKGAAFCPNPERARVTKNKNHDTWLVVKALFSDEKPVVTLAEIWAAIPTHKDFVSYAWRSGWLAAGAPAAQ